MPDSEEKKQKVLAAADPKHHSLIEKASQTPESMTEEETQGLVELVAKGHGDLSKNLANASRRG
ncbi:hypothetical protein LTR51_008670 [Lithohypha guttulata]|nr:hypothetical protein LTR51_008670 [Lithohypha guttulata]